jgi:hypothetical protein
MPMYERELIHISRERIGRRANRHRERAGAIEAQRDAFEKRSYVEDARWQKQKEKLQIVLRLE